MSACGAAYISPSVDFSDDNVTVVEITQNSLAQANASAFTPRALPAVFFQDAGGVTGMRGIGAVPAASATPQTRPTSLQTRIPPEVPAGPYRIGVGDVVLLATKGAGTTVEELSGLLAAQNRRQGYTIQDDGAAAIPDVGRIRLAGLTLEEAEVELFQALVENQIDPSFSLEIAEFNSQRVSVGGAVHKPKVAKITLTPLHLDEAILAAGGVDVEDREYATIRIYRDGTLYQLPMTAYLENRAMQRIRMKDGDSVFVDTEYELSKAQAYFQEQITLGDYRRSARTAALDELQSAVNLRRAALAEQRENFQARVALAAVERDYVYLVGEVTRPGRFEMPFGHKATLADALFSDGGFSSETGNPSQIYLLRDMNGDGQVTAWHLNARNAANFLLATRLEVRPNDVVFIAEQPITKWNRVIQQFVPSLITAGVAAAN
nr:polysaccharide biosynthesis/export family protein [Aliiroseovarius subalbicans]